MADVLARYAALHGGKTAVIDDRPNGPTVTYSYRELNERSNQLAVLLGELGVTSRTKVLWCGKNSAGILLATHAARKLGATGVPLNYRLSPREAAYIVDHSDATVILVDAEHRALIGEAVQLAGKVTEVLEFDGDGDFEVGLDRYPSEDIEPEDGAVGGTMTYTSGTTGTPKGALRPPSANPTHGAGIVKAIGYQPDDVHLITGPLYHSGPGGAAALALALGNTIVVQRKFDAEDWLRLVDEHRVTTTFTAPTPIRSVCTLDESIKRRYDRSSMKRLMANAAPWTLALKKMYLADFPADSLYEVYGSTELGVNTVLGPEDHLRKPGSCGRPVPGVEIKLFSSDGSEITEPHVKGDLYVRGDGLYSSYYKDRERFDAERKGDFHTVGDVAYFDDEGYFYIADRKKDMIITGGMNVYPAEVEAALEESPQVTEAAVIGVPSDHWGESVHAFVVAADEMVTEEDILSFAANRLANYKRPRSVTFVTDLPRTGSGKVLKRELRTPFWSGSGRNL